MVEFGFVCPDIEHAGSMSLNILPLLIPVQQPHERNLSQNI